jgi:hypothetical protein
MNPSGVVCFEPNERRYGGAQSFFLTSFSLLFTDADNGLILIFF